MSVSLAFYDPKYKEYFETYDLPHHQLQYTSLPLHTVYTCRELPNRFPVVILFENKAVGFLLLNGWERVREYSDNQEALLLTSYSVNARYQGKGIAKQSLKLLPLFINQHFPEKRELILAVNHRNKAAQIVYEKAGFVDKGIRLEGPKGELFVYHMNL
ncbi:GNAT family N-acetyltransferase [Metabacillus iocasae]|uniref:RimJ/RimL family protein N-acetyltransferase n=1 Tax=Priestia iocasae TaxID=2291674 RepID=A0ABS2R032_9BACI|nr:GNAT family N-acetyltransferase [Metabacillus iocasae]MBM7705050.1 RimJ/RimL family protein N-acetyltransferase [Metabacillus iocasae]